jgi:carbon-monoxide dehydrogenase large subunit
MPAFLRREDGPLLTGTALFAGDVQRPGQLWLGVVRSPTASGTLVGIDAADALALPSVHAVLTAKDCGSVPSIPIRVHARPGMERHLQPVLAFERVRYVGEPLAVVVADDPYAAEDAVDRVRAEIEIDEPFLGGERLWTDTDDERVIWKTAGRFGDVDAAFAAADLVVEAELLVPRQTGLPMETRGLVAEWVDGALHMWGPTKFLQFTKTTLAALLEIDVDDVHCHRVDVGGMFGVRGEFYPEDFLVPWAARKVGRPVKWIEDRREHLVSINQSREQRHRCAVALAKDGTLLGMRDEAQVDMGAYARPIGARMIELAAHLMPGPYRWPAFDVSSRGLATNKTPSGTMRGPGSFETTFVRERMLDLAAGRLRMDPLELRRKNLLTADELPIHLELDGPLDAVELDEGDYPASLADVLERCGYDELRADADRRRANGELVGLGLGLFAEHSGLGGEECVELELADDGSLVLWTSATEVGQGLASTMAHVLTAAIPIPAERVRVETAADRLEGVGRGTFSSRSTLFVGSAAHDACARLLEEARERAGAALSCTAAQVEVTEAGLTFDDGLVTWAELAPLRVAGRHAMAHPTYGFGANIALVAVEPETGEVRVERLVTAFDAGRAIDPDAAAGQLAGAALMGVGGTLYEEIAYADNGEPITTTFMDYLAPTSAERPEIEAHVLETVPSPGNPLGARGVGEAGIAGVGAAIANAAADALGRPADAILLELPLKPSRVAELVQPEWLADETVPERVAGGSSARDLRELLPAAAGVALGAVMWLGRRRARTRHPRDQEE